MQQADKFFEQGDFQKAFELFIQSGQKERAAFTLLMQAKSQQELEQVQHFYQSLNNSISKRWGKFLLHLFARNTVPQELPSFLTFRFLFEPTFSYFLRFKKRDFIKAISENLAGIERHYPYASKDIGVALFNENLLEEAQNILLKALSRMPKDTAIIFKLALIARTNNDQKTFKFYLDKIDEILPDNSLTKLYK